MSFRKTFFLVFVFFSINNHLFSQQEMTLPSWAKNINPSFEPPKGEHYYFVETNSGHFGVVNEKFHLVTDTVYRNYCRSPFELPDRKTIFYFMQKAAPGKTSSDFDGDWVIADAKGKQLNELTFYKPYNFLNASGFYASGTYMCNGDGKWGKLNQDLKWAEQPLYDSLWCLFWDTLSDRTSFMVKENGKYGILDSGKVVVPCNYTKAIFGFGGYFVLLKNEKETVVYEPFTKSLLNFDSLLLCESKMYSTYRFYSDHNYDINLKRLPGSTEQKINHSEYLMKKTAYDLRMTNGEIFSPQLYSPDNDDFHEVEKYAYPFYQPLPAYVPWFHFLSSYPDSDFFSFAYYYNTYDRYLKSWKEDDMVEQLNYNPTIFHYCFSKQDSISYINYSIRGDTCYPITLDSIFKKGLSVEQQLKPVFLEEMKKNKIQLPKGDWMLYNNFYFTQKEIVLLFRCSEKDAKGNVQIYGMNFSWSMLNAFIDPKGPLRNKIS